MKNQDNLIESTNYDCDDKLWKKIYLDLKQTFSPKNQLSMDGCKYCRGLRKCFIHDLVQGEYRHRKIDGSNNNSKNSTYGKTGQNFRRIAGYDYTDGLNSPSGQNRPSARVISNEIFNQDESSPDSHDVTNMFWLWGQFVDHAITLTDAGDDKFPISVPKGDQYFDPESTGGKTISLNRSLYKSEAGKPREQFNQLSPLLDGSMVYGHNDERASYLREFKDGRMKTSQGEMLPFYVGELPNAGSSKFGSFIGGDVRCNEHIGLASMHTLFVREHNHWAEKIKCHAPHLEDEEIYQMVKMVVEAEIQAITYNEFLPILLGQDGMKSYSGYDSKVDPQLANEFSAAAYRFGHAMVATNMYGETRDLRDTFFASHIICNDDGIEPILEQFCSSGAETLNAKLIHDLRNFLFGKPGQGGHDLAALNIQRGRDHGLAPYNQVRKVLGLSYLEHEEYKHDANDMDLFVGGLLETPVEGALVGETFHHILKDQFERIRDGDRFWYRRRFNQKQCNYIEGITLGQIIYRHTKNDKIQNDVFHMPNKKKRRCRKCKCGKRRCRCGKRRCKCKKSQCKCGKRKCKCEKVQDQYQKHRDKCQNQQCDCKKGRGKCEKDHHQD